MERSPGEPAHDYEAFLENTPPGFYRYYALGSLFILGAAIVLLTKDLSDLLIGVVAAVGVGLLTLLAVLLIRRYSRV